MSELQEKAQHEFKDFMESCRAKIAATIRDEADKILSNCYTDYGMFLETDAWTNYREHLKKELAGGFYKTATDSEDGNWGRRVREMIMVEHREELIKALNADLVEQNERLRQELKQAYERRL